MPLTDFQDGKSFGIFSAQSGKPPTHLEWDASEFQEGWNVGYILEKMGQSPLPRWYVYSHPDKNIAITVCENCITEQSITYFAGSNDKLRALCTKLGLTQSFFILHTPTLTRPLEPCDSCGLNPADVL